MPDSPQVSAHLPSRRPTASPGTPQTEPEGRYETLHACPDGRRFWEHPLTVAQLRAALDGVDPDLAVVSGYYTCHDVSILHCADAPSVLMIGNSE